jgi:hypothetical protein
MPRLLARGIVLVGLVAVLWISGLEAERQLSPSHIGVDDASIYFRYARNLAHGLGCVWNPGGERVEGCSSILWTAVCTVILTITPAPEPLAFAAGVTFGALAAVIVAFGIARLLDEDQGTVAILVAGLLVGAWILASPGHVVWMTAARMETPLWTATIALAWCAASAWMRAPGSRPRQVALGICAALVALGRPEGPLLAIAVVGAAALIRRRRDRTFAATFPDILLPALITLTSIIAMLVGRRLYFGFMLPNTWYAKVDDDFGYRSAKGLRYLWSFVDEFPVASAACVVASTLVIVTRRSPPAMLATVLLTFGVANAIFVGGDHFGFWRILQPYWLLALVPIAGVFARIEPVGSRIAASAGASLTVAALTLFMATLPWNRLSESEVKASFLIANAGRAVATGFNEIFPKDQKPTVGVVAGGTFPFVFDGPCFDLLGLNDVEMAHASGRRRGVMHGHGAFHAPTFFRRPPDLLIGVMRPGVLAAPEPPADRIPFGTLTSEEERRFDALYVAVAIWTEDSRQLGVMMPAWARRDWLAQVGGRYPIREIETK